MTVQFIYNHRSNDLTDRKTFSHCLMGIVGLAVMGVLTSCGGTGQDKPSTTVANISTAEEQTTLTGVALDGPLARATVYIDTNSNSRRDPWEPYAFTDDDGYYSKNPAKNIDYCAANAPADYAQYCLKARGFLLYTVIRMEGGYDTLTGEPFYGQMSRRIDIVNGGSAINAVVSPLTTLLASSSNGMTRNLILSSLGLVSSDLDVEYVTPGGAVNTKILNAALKVQKITSILSDRLTDVYTKIGEEAGTPNDATAIVYKNIADELIAAKNFGSTQSSFSDLATNKDVLQRIVNTSEEKLKEIYTANQLDLPADSGKPASINNLRRSVEVASHINQVVDTLIPTATSTVTKNEIIGGARVLEALLIKSVKETTTSDASIDNQITFINTPDNAGLVDNLKASLTSNNIDLSELAKHNFNKSDLDTPEKIAAVTRLPETVMPFYRMGGTLVKVSSPDLGQAPNNLKDEEIEFYFKGDAQSLNGEFSACAKHIKGAKSDGTLGKGNTRGELIKGYWSLLGASTNGGKAYSLLLTINFLGTTYQAIMKPAGKVLRGNTEMDSFRFDNGDDFVVWNSSTGIVSNNQIPESAKECEARLPSRVGI